MTNPSLFDMPEPEERRAPSRCGPTRTTGEAIDLLRRTRKKHIDAAREVATELIRLRGETHARAVYEVMQQRGLIDPSVGDFWLGAVFNHRSFSWTGRWHAPALEDYADTRAHAPRPVKVWMLKES